MSPLTLVRKLPLNASDGEDFANQEDEATSPFPPPSGRKSSRMSLVAEFHTEVRHTARSLDIAWKNAPPVIYPRLDGCYFDAHPMKRVRPIPIFPDLMDKVCCDGVHPFTN